MKTFLALTVATVMLGGVALGTPIKIDPKSSFLMADIPGVTTVGQPSPLLADTPLDPIFVPVIAGQTINIVALGNLCYAGTAAAGPPATPCNGIAGGPLTAELAGVLGGVFTQTNALLDDTHLQRLPTAVNSGLPGYSNTGTNLFFHNTVSTANSFDFLIPTGLGVTVVVPAGVHFLVVGVFDSFYKDNSDPNNDLAVLITTQNAIPEPATYALMLAGLAGLLTFERKRLPNR